MKTKTDETLLSYTLGTPIPACQLGDLAERLKGFPEITIGISLEFDGPDQMPAPAAALVAQWLRSESPTNDEIFALIGEIRKPLEHTPAANPKAKVKGKR